MKNLLIVAFVLFSSTISFAQGTVEDDNENGTSLVPILKDLEPYIEDIEGDGLEIVRMEIDILQTTKTTLRRLSSAYTYGVLVIGDYRFTDLNLKVYEKIDGNWELVVQDLDYGKEAIVFVEPDESKEYLIEIISEETADGYLGGHYGLLIVHE